MEHHQQNLWELLLPPHADVFHRSKKSDARIPVRHAFPQHFYSPSLLNLRSPIKKQFSQWLPLQKGFGNVCSKKMRSFQNKKWKQNEKRGLCRATFFTPQAF